MTGSEVGRILACPTSAVLPHTDAPSAWSDEGEQRHLDAEVAAELGDLEGLPPRVAELIRGAEAVMTEVAVVYDAATDTARPLPGVKNRAYPEGLSPFETPMTVDLGAFFSGPRRLVVIDHKLYADQGEPKDHGQLMTEALAMARAYNVDEVTIAISYLGTNWVDIDNLDLFDLAAHAERLQELHLKVEVARRQPRPQRGPHCRHCPAFFACPAWSTLIERVRRGDVGVEVQRFIPFETDQQASAGFKLLGDLEMLSKRMSAALHARAKESPIPLPDGKVWGPRAALGNETLDGVKVYAVAAETYGIDKAAGFVEMKATKKRISAALTPLVPRGTKTKASDELLKVVRARGGASRKSKTSYEVYDPTQAAPTLPAAAPAEEGADNGSDD